MNAISIILLVAFVIVCFLLVCLVLVQNEEGGGMGGVFGGANSTAFGSRSGTVITKTTYILVTLFFVTSFVLAFLNRVPTVKQLDPSVLQAQTANGETKSWLDEDEAASETPAVLTDTENTTAEPVNATVESVSSEIDTEAETGESE
ncbi:MAG: hypothetical protein Ta2A_26470 [Treponemataceae bacterium]|nr:MAG: hypothetical protein Ta2A_26470 [Treponemataceae bacterium]